MHLFRLIVAILWLSVMLVTIHAVSTMGLNAAGSTFFGDFSHPWRAQFNTDFVAQLVLSAGWMVFRDRNLGVGLVWGAAEILLGGAFGLSYVFVATFRSQDGFAGVMMGHRPGLRA
jgi:hypothetical protein